MGGSDRWRGLHGLGARSFRCHARLIHRRFYVNFLSDEGEARVRAAYPGGTFERLARIKCQYDPDNFFRLNQNIRPSVQPHEAAAASGVSVESHASG